MTTPITVAAARALLTAEGNTPEDVATAIDSLYSAGFAIPTAQQRAVAYQGPDGTTELVIAWGPLAWTIPGVGLPGYFTLLNAVQDMSRGEWIPTDADGWFPLDAEFQPEAATDGWTWTKVAEAEAASIDQMLLTEDDLTVLREQLAEWAAQTVRLVSPLRGRRRSGSTS